MATTLTNPAATGGIDFGSLMDKAINAYSTVSVARLDRDTARYNAAAQTQQATLNPSEALTQSGAYATGNAAGQQTAGMGMSYWSQIPKPLLYGSAALLVGALAWRMVK